ncbi:hypothetical protein PAPYR_1351 [Paratrimastix pyriformis]|uniref:Citrate transporter-like domain-containing protein n=1 Tax=Paratrimastix pyriformis TaxID=342808 RepID=A0ABQ8UUX0_9EUKA|nr:hypothetical protein PAPYR_1351 [Paratrimastix pyriformis]
MALHWELPRRIAPWVSIPIYFGMMILYAYPSMKFISNYGRPAFGLCGAVLMIFLGVLLPEDAVSMVDGDLVIQVIAMGIFVAFLDACGIIESAVQQIRALFLHRRPLVAYLMFCGIAFCVCAFISPLYAAILLTPVVCRFCQSMNFPLTPYLVAFTLCANASSILFPFSGSLAGAVFQCRGCSPGATGLGWLDFLKLFPATLILIAACVGGMLLAFRKRLGDRTDMELADLSPADSSLPPPPPEEPNPSNLRRRIVTPKSLKVATTVLLAVALLGRLVGLHTAWTLFVCAGLLLYFFFDRSDSFLLNVDWLLILTGSMWQIMWGAVASSGVMSTFWSAVGLTSLDSAGAVCLFVVYLVVSCHLVGPPRTVLTTLTLVGSFPTLSRAHLLILYVCTASCCATQLSTNNNLFIAVRAKPSQAPSWAPKAQSHSIPAGITRSPFTNN